MKKIPFKIQLFAVMLVLAAAFFGFQAQVRSSAENKAAASASGATAFKMAVIDVQALLSKSEAAKSIQEQINTEREQLQKAVIEQEQKLKEQEKALIASNGKVSEAEFNKNKAALEKNVMEARQQFQRKKRALEDAAGKSLESLREEITVIVAELSDKDKYDIVVTRQNVVLAVKSMDLTEEVMSRLNDKIKKIDLKVETN